MMLFRRLLINLTVVTAWAIFYSGNIICVKATENPLPAELAALIAQAQNAYQAEKYADAVQILAEYAGTDHPARHILIGHSETQRSDFSAAVTAYGRALALDPENRTAGIARAQAFAYQKKWLLALADAGHFINPEHASATEVLFFAQTAFRAEDLRLCRELTRKALERFPLDTRVRRLDLALLLTEREWLTAAQVAAILLSQTPEDCQLWEQRAYAAQSSGQHTEAAAAAEAAWLLSPDDPARLQTFLMTQIEAGHLTTVLKAGDDFFSKLSQSNAAAPTADSSPKDALLLKTTDADTIRNFQELFIRTADACSADVRLRKWLTAIPSHSYSRETTLCAARLELRSGIAAAARNALQTLIANNQADANICLWAGKLAEDSDDFAAAETYYRQAIAAKNTSAAVPSGAITSANIGKTVPQATATARAPRLAALHLARFLWAQKRIPEAQSLLEKYLQSFPEDAAARAMLASIGKKY